jgi:two-component system LytT family response regulator
MRTCVIDNSKQDREELIRFLNQKSHINVCWEASNLSDAFKKLDAINTDLLFLDADLPDKNGFDILKRNNINTHIIITADNEFTLRAFEKIAVDYLLKPINEHRLDRAIKKAEKLFKQNDKVIQKPILDTDNKVFIQDRKKCNLIKVGDIRYVETYGNYCYVHFKNSKVLLNKSLNYIAKRLSPETFFRVNRQYIININYIKDIFIWNNESYRVELTCSKRIDFSRRKTKKFIQKMSL